MLVDIWIEALYKERDLSKQPEYLIDLYRLHLNLSLDFFHETFLPVITKTSPCNEDPLTPHFLNIVKLGFKRDTFFSYFCSKTYIVGTR